MGRLAVNSVNSTIFFLLLSKQNPISNVTVRVPLATRGSRLDVQTRSRSVNELKVGLVASRRPAEDYLNAPYSNVLLGWVGIRVEAFRQEPVTFSQNSRCWSCLAWCCKSMYVRTYSAMRCHVCYQDAVPDFEISYVRSYVHPRMHTVCRRFGFFFSLAFGGRWAVSKMVWWIPKRVHTIPRSTAKKSHWTAVTVCMQVEMWKILVKAFFSSLLALSFFCLKSGYPFFCKCPRTTSLC